MQAEIYILRSRVPGCSRPFPAVFDFIFRSFALITILPFIAYRVALDSAVPMHTLHSKSTIEISQKSKNGVGNAQTGPVRL